LTANLAYLLVDGKLTSREVSEIELVEARANAQKQQIVMRSCWNCNHAHERFLADLTDRFFFVCFDCGHYYYQGIDITDFSPEDEADPKPIMGSTE